MAAPSDSSEEWNFYLCRVDDAPASIFLNLHYRHEPSPEGKDTLYWVRVEMLDPGEHGMGDDAEADAVYPALDELVEGADIAGLQFVGRLRNDGAWQLVFYGAAGRQEALDALSRRLGKDVNRETESGNKHDPNWRYYHDFLMPDAERYQWIKDCRVVEILAERGDPLTEPRRVDHWAYFPSAAERDSFVAAATERGFSTEELDDDEGSGGLRHRAQIHRIDSVQLEDIHSVVMQLYSLAEKSGGKYDGWETSVEAPDAGES